MLVLLKAKFWDDVAENCFLLAAKSLNQRKKNNGKGVHSTYFLLFIWCSPSPQPSLNDSELELSLSSSWHHFLYRNRSWINLALASPRLGVLTALQSQSMDGSRAGFGQAAENIFLLTGVLASSVGFDMDKGVSVCCWIPLFCLNHYWMHL